MRGWRMLIAGVLALLAGCTRDGSREPSRPLAVVQRITDDRAAAAGDPEPAVATIGYTSRYVLSAPRAVLLSPLHPEGVVATESGEVVYPMQCPAELAGRSFVLDLAIAGRDLIRQPALARCESPDGSVTARFRAAPGEKVIALARAHLPPSNEAIRGAWLEVPEGARLRAAVGLADPRKAGEFGPVRMRAAAENADAKRVTLYEGELTAAQWQEIDVALAPAVETLGRRLRLVFEAEGRADEPHFAVWADPQILAPATAPATAAPRRNVVVVSLDTLRPDRLGLYGARRRTSPSLDQIGERGAVFERALSAAPHTFPSHATMLSGLYPCAHGLGAGAETLFHRFPRPVVPIAEVLRRAGYTAAAFTEDAFVAAESFQRGFGSFRADKTDETIGGPPLGNAQATFAGASSWVRDHGDEPFFLFVHTYQVHEPYTPPEAFAKLFSPGDGTVDAVAAKVEGRQDLLALYDAEIRMTDGLLAEFLATLEQQGIAERTIVVVTSDHGQGFGAHGYPGHGNLVHDDTMWVPMVWSAPGLIAPGRRQGGVVSVADIAPTLYELLGVPPPHELHGRSLAGVLTRGEALDPARTVFGKGLARVAPSMVHGSGWKVIREDDGRGAFFDLQADPYEQQPQPGTDAAAGLASLQEHDRACGLLRARLDRDRPAASTAPDPERDRKLRALGYIE